MSPARNFARLVGVVLTLFGILGLIPGMTSNGGLLFGVFAVNSLHIFFYLLTGLLGLAAGLGMRGRGARFYALVFGLLFAVLAIVGWMQGPNVFGLLRVNLADNILHALIALMGLASFLMTPTRVATPVAPVVAPVVPTEATHSREI